MKRELKIFAVMVGIFVVFYFLPLGNPRIQAAIQEAFRLLQWYARNHTLACVVPALFIAGAIITFLSQSSVMHYLGPNANLPLAYGVASVSGYSGPAINILAIFLSARVLGFSIGVGRFVGAVLFSVVIGLLMALIFRRAERAKAQAALQMPQPERPNRHIGKTAVFLASMILFLVFSDWYNPGNVVVKTTDGRQFKAVVIHETKDMMRFQLEQDLGEAKLGDKIEVPKAEIADMQEQKTWVIRIHHIRWYLAGLCGLAVLIMAWRWFQKDELRQWMHNTWGFAKLLVPLLFGEPRCQRRRGLLVLRDAHRDPHYAGVDEVGYAQGARLGVTSGGPGPVAAQHLSHQESYGQRKDNRVHRIGRRDVNNSWDSLRRPLGIDK